METSIIIRTKNEEKWIGAVLQRLTEQTYKNFEIVIVDSGSTDKTLEIVQKFPVRLFYIKPEEFSYPFALNFGCEKASATKYFVFLSGHSLPVSKTWLENGVKNFTSDKILGVYGGMQALPDGTLWEKFFFNSFKVKVTSLFNRKITVNKAGMGVMGFTHAIIRKDLWEKHKFDERYGMGGEDEAWVDYWFKQGYVAVKDAKFSVAHSHELGLSALIKQYRYWQSTVRPQPFRELEFRNNNKEK